MVGPLYLPLYAHIYSILYGAKIPKLKKNLQITRHFLRKVKLVFIFVHALCMSVQDNTWLFDFFPFLIHSALKKEDKSGYITTCVYEYLFWLFLLSFVEGSSSDWFLAISTLIPEAFSHYGWAFLGTD